MRIVTILGLGLGLSLSSLADEAFPLGPRGGLQNNLWTNVGISGGIPAVSTVYTNLTTANTLAQANTAIQNCPSNQVVLLAGGTYSWNGLLVLKKDGVVVRGTTNAQGKPITDLPNVTPAWQASTADYPPVLWSAAVRNVSSGFTEGSTRITVATTPGANYAVGNLMFMDMKFDTNVGVWDSANETFFRTDRPLIVGLLITNISGNDIDFWPPLIGTNWFSDAADDIQTFAFASDHTTTHRVGLEDVHITVMGDDDQFGVLMWNTYECWIKNVWFQPNRNHGASNVGPSWSVKCNIEECYAYDGINAAGIVPEPGGANSDNPYAFILTVANSCRIEHNSVTNCGEPFTSVCTVGTVFAFNTTLGRYDGGNNPDTWLLGSLTAHCGQSQQNIWEGNHCAMVIFDRVFGESSAHNAIVRNRLIGWAAEKTANTYPISIGSDGSGSPDQRNTTILGNVLGAPNYHTSYSEMYFSDAWVTGTFKTNNFNTVNGAINSAEAIGGNTMLDSYVHAGPPARWGDRQWPFISPVSTATNLLYYTNVPSGYRLYYGEWPASASEGEPSVGVTSLGGNVVISGNVIIR